MSHRWFRWIFGVVVIATISTTPSTQSDQLDADTIIEFDKVFNQLMLCKNITGWAVTVYRAGRLLYQRSLGKADVATGKPMHPNETLLAMASISKGMTSAVVSNMQPHYRSIDWQWTSKVRRYIADFWQTDMTRSQETTLRDLAGHAMGIARHDFLWLLSNLTQQQIIDRIPSLKASMNFRASWNYNNLFYLLLGHVMERATGHSYRNLVRRYLFEPLAMSNRAVFAGEITLEQRRHLIASLPKVYIMYRNQRISIDQQVQLSVRNVEPAAGIYLPLVDVARYVKHLSLLDMANFSDPMLATFLPVSSMHNELKPQKEQLFKLHHQDEEPLMNSIKYVNTRYSAPPPHLQETYAKGWIRGFYRNRVIYHHEGNLYGQRNALYFDVDNQVAIFLHAILLVTKETPEATLYITNLPLYMMDRVQKLPSWLNLDNVCDYYKVQESSSPTTVAPPPFVQSAKPSTDCAEGCQQPLLNPQLQLSGRYTHAVFGTLVITCLNEMEKEPCNLKLKYSRWGSFPLQLSEKQPGDENVLRFKTIITGSVWFLNPIGGAHVIIHLAQAAAATSSTSSEGLRRGVSVELPFLEPRLTPTFLLDCQQHEQKIVSISAADKLHCNLVITATIISMLTYAAHRALYKELIFL